MRFDTKLFRLFFAYSFTLILLISIVLLSLFYKQYSDARKDHLYFLNVLLQTQTGYIVGDFERSAGEISNSRDMESFLGDDPVSGFFAEKFLLEHFNSTINKYPYLSEIRIQRGDTILLSSREPLEVDISRLVSKDENSLYRVVKIPTLIEKTNLIYIVSVNDFLSDFNSLHRMPYDQISYFIDKTWAVLFDEKGDSVLYRVEIESDSGLIIHQKQFLYSRIDTPHIVQIVISQDSLYENLSKTALILLIFVSFSGFALFLIIRVTSRSLTLPIRELSKHASSIQSGVLEHFEYEGTMVDEFENLMTSFNYMTDKNRDFTTKLELEVKNRTRVIEDQKKELEKISLTDKLTGLFNRRSFDEQIVRDFDLAVRTNLYIGLGVIDIDFFKQVNDSYGHLCGDKILKSVSGLLIKMFRRNCDSIFRYGGDEFIILTLNKGDHKSEFLSMAEKLRSEIDGQLFEYEEGKKKLHITISMGLFFGKVDKVENYEYILNIADNMLYRVKELGRNKVLIND